MWSKSRVHTGLLKCGSQSGLASPHQSEGCLTLISADEVKRAKMDAHSPLNCATSALQLSHPVSQFPTVVSPSVPWRLEGRRSPGSSEVFRQFAGLLASRRKTGRSDRSQGLTSEVSTLTDLKRFPND